MSHHLPESSRGDCLRPTDLSLLSSPLDFIQEEHLREREICAALCRIATSTVPPTDEVTGVIGFLRDELPLHLQDEEEDLFPLLKRRCEPEDEISKIISRLVEDHDHAQVDSPAVNIILESVLAGTKALSEHDRASLRRFATHARRHLILENAIILPFAKLRLTESDLQTLTLRMSHRRDRDHMSDTKRC